MTIYNGKDFGTITLVWGSMYSGKTEELTRRLRRANIAGQKYQLFRPEKDDRYDKVETHYGVGLEAEVIKSSFELFEKVDQDTKIVGIDEGQFFDNDFVYVCKRLKSEYHIDVIISGLDMNCFGVPYNTMSELAAISNECIKYNAVCVDCGNDAYISHILIDDDSGQVVGSNDIYIALCEKDYIIRNANKDMKKKKKNNKRDA